MFFHWALVFFVVALVAAALGQSGVAGLSARVGRLFVLAAVVVLVLAMLAGRGPVLLR